MTTVLPIKKQDRTVTIDVQKPISSELIKKKIYLAELADITLKNYLKDEEELSVNNEYSVYKLPIVNEEINIIDFKINSLDVNVVMTVDREKNNNVYIPKIYKTLNYTPDIIIFLNFKKSLAKVEILGLLDNVNLISTAIPKENLIPSENLIDILKTQRTKYNVTEDSVIKTSRELMLGYINNELSEEGKKLFCKHLLTSQEVRKDYKLFYAMNCKFIAVVENCDVKERDYTLDVFSGRLPNSNNNILLEENIKQNIEEDLEENTTVENKTDFDEETVLINNDSNNSNDINLEFQNDILPIDNAEPIQENTEEDILQDIQQETPQIQNTQEDIISEDDILENDASENIISDNLLPDEASNSISESEHSEIEINDNFDVDNLDLQLDENDINNLSEENIDLDLLNDKDFSDIDELQEDRNLEEINEEETVEITTHEETPPTPIPASSLVASDYTPIEEPTPLEQAIHESVEETQEDIFDMLSELSDSQETNVEFNSIDEDDLNYLEENSYIDNISSENPVNETTNIEPTPTTDILKDMPEFSTDTPDFSKEFSEAIANTNENAEVISNEQSAINTALEHHDKKKSSGKGLLIVLLLFVVAGACGAGAFFKFMSGNPLSKIKKQESIPMPIIPETQPTQDIQDNDIPAPTPLPSPNDNTQQEKLPQPATTENNTKSDLPPVDGAPTLPDAPEKPLPKIPQGVKPKQLHEVVGMAISKDYNKVRISHVWWGVPSGLDSVPVVSEYLKITGESVKSALSRSLADATDMAQNYGVVLTITYKKDGSVVRTQMTKGSGSQQIDGIIQSTVEQTLNLTKMPALKINKEEYNVELHIDL